MWTIDPRPFVRPAWPDAIAKRIRQLLLPTAGTLVGTPARTLRALRRNQPGFVAVPA